MSAVQPCTGRKGKEEENLEENKVIIGSSKTETTFNVESAYRFASAPRVAGHANWQRYLYFFSHKPGTQNKVKTKCVVTKNRTTRN